MVRHSSMTVEESRKVNIHGVRLILAFAIIAHQNFTTAGCEPLRATAQRRLPYRRRFPEAYLDMRVRSANAAAAIVQLRLRTSWRERGDCHQPRRRQRPQRSSSSSANGSRTYCFHHYWAESER